jgi:hypothetical protein
VIPSLTLEQWILVYAAVTGSIGAFVGLLRWYSDRTRVAVSVRLEPAGDLPFHYDEDYVLLRAVVKGRSAIEIEDAGLIAGDGSAETAEYWSDSRFVPSLPCKVPPYGSFKLSLPLRCLRIGGTPEAPELASAMYVDDAAGARHVSKVPRRRWEKRLREVNKGPDTDSNAGARGLG